VYYFSLEFLMGRMMQNALVNIDMEDKYKDALMDIGYNLEDLYE
jgi:glycogen phosphorylase